MLYNKAIVSFSGYVHIYLGVIMSDPEQIIKSEEECPPVSAIGTAPEPAKNEDETKDHPATSAGQETPQVFHIMGFKKSWEEDDVTYDYKLLDGNNNLHTYTIPIALDAILFEPCTIERDNSGVVTKITPYPTKKTRDEIINDFFENIKTSDIEGTVKSKNGKGILNVATSTGEVKVFGHKLVELMGIKKGYHIKVFGDLKEKNCRKQCDAFVILGKEHIKTRKKDKKNKDVEAETSYIPSPTVSHPFLEMARQLQTKIPYHYDPHKIFWVWKNNCWIMADEVDILNHLKNFMAYTEFFDHRSKTGVMDAIKMSGREREVKEVPKEWVYTLSGVFDIKTKKIHEATPEYFFTNPIPHKIGTSSETPKIDNLFKNWAGTKHISLTEWSAYCLYNGYPIHRIHTCFGSGGNGKGQYAEFLIHHVGKDNTCTANLNKLISSRFEGVKLYRKKLCIIDETPETIPSTNELKALSGEGNVSVEIKGIQGFDMQNIAKITMLTNNVPETKDKTDSWYRRSMLTDFPNKFKEGKPIINTIPEDEYENFLAKCLNILPNLLDRGDFTLDLPLEEKKTAYERASNRVKHFIDEYCTYAPETPTWQLLKVFNEKFAVKYGCRTLSKQEFNKALGNEGYDLSDKYVTEDNRRVHWMIVFGLGLKDNQNTRDNRVADLSGMRGLSINA